MSDADLSPVFHLASSHYQCRYHGQNGQKRSRKKYSLDLRVERHPWNGQCQGRNRYRFGPRLHYRAFVIMGSSLSYGVWKNMRADSSFTYVCYWISVWAPVVNVISGCICVTDIIFCQDGSSCPRALVFITFLGQIELHMITIPYGLAAISIEFYET